MHSRKEARVLSTPGIKALPTPHGVSHFSWLSDHARLTRLKEEIVMQSEMKTCSFFVFVFFSTAARTIQIKLGTMLIL